MCCCHLACCYKALPFYSACILFLEFILGIIRIAIFFPTASLLTSNSRAIAGFILDWISSFAATLLGLLVTLTVLLIILGCLTSCNKDGTYSPDHISTRRPLRFLWRLKALHRLIQLNCNCPCYVARPKFRFIIRLAFLFVCFIFRIVAIALYATAGNDTAGGLLAAVCALSLACLALTFLIDLYQYCVWWHYRPQCDTKCSLLSRKHKRYIPYHLMGDNRTMRFGDEPCAEGSQCKNRRLEHILIFHLDDHKPQERYGQVEQATPGKNRYIGFHRTNSTAAVSIAHGDFRISTKHESTMLGHGVYFARSLKETEGKANQKGAYICAEIEMGKVKEVNPGPEKNSLRGTTHLWEEYDTVYYHHPNDNRDEFCVKSPDQILKWVMVIEKNHDEKVTNYGLDKEFDDTVCGCI